MSMENKCRSLVLPAFDVISCLRIRTIDASGQLAGLFINNFAKPNYVEASAYELSTYCPDILNGKRRFFLNCVMKRVCFYI